MLVIKCVKFHVVSKGKAAVIVSSSSLAYEDLVHHQCRGRWKTMTWLLRCEQVIFAGQSQVSTI